MGGRTFRAGVGRDFMDADGSNARGDIGLSGLAQGGVDRPHLPGVTGELSADNGGVAVRAILDVAGGYAPRFVVNRDALGLAVVKDGLGQPAPRGGTAFGGPS